jgi:hypothetical protein
VTVRVTKPRDHPTRPNRYLSIYYTKSIVLV